jgi:acetyltransferase-like isoleucine patch superfamily enzyme
MRDPHTSLRLVKALANLIAIALTLPMAVTCWLEEGVRHGSEDVFRFWTNTLAVLPGGPGVYLRRAFYHLTLTRCSLNCWIGFGSLFSHRQAEVSDEVYIGPYSVIGCARLQTGCLIGTRASLLSGLAQHERRQDGRWAPAGAAQFQQITVGSHAWIGEAAVLMADIGAGALVGAGSVVSSPVPPGVVVAGNPARFVRDSAHAGLTSGELELVEAAQEPAAYAGIIDWFKCLGMLVIVYGHLVGWGPLASLPPIYSKQLGVALFLFITGYSLSQETRERQHVFFNRLFEAYLWAGALALGLSAFTYLSEGRLLLSNYAPLAGGINVIFNFFPANPTTWYLGTYLHVLALWALVLYRVRVSPQVLLGSLVIEVIVRAFLIGAAGRFVAYMALTNWSTVFLLGMWYGQRRRSGAHGLPDHAAAAAGLALVGLIAGWSIGTARLPFEPDFPFMSLSLPDAATGVFLTSLAVSAVYLSVTWLAFHALAPFPAPRPVRFVARNTLIIFLGHMPVLFALTPLLSQLDLSRGVRSLALAIICVPGLGLLSEVLRKALQIRKLRDQVYRRLSGWKEPLVAARP